MTTAIKRETRVYELLRDIVETRGGRMWHEAEGYGPGGAWIVKLGSNRRTFRSNGAGFPQLDWLYVRKVVYPRHARDFRNELVGDAKAAFLALVEAGDA